MLKNFKPLFFLFLILLAIGCIGYYLLVLGPYSRIEDRYEPKKSISLDQNGPAAAQKPELVSQDRLRIAIAPIVSPAKTLPIYAAFGEYLTAALKKKVVLVQRNSYAEVNDLVRHNACDMAFVCTYSFVQGERDYGLELIVTPQVKGKNSYQCYIITRPGAGYQTLFDLRGKRFGSNDILSTSGWLYPAVRLMKAGENPKTFFAELVLTGSHDRTVNAVATGFVDGAAVQSLVYDQMVREDPSLGTKITVIDRSPDYGMPPVVVHPRMDRVLKNHIAEIMLHMHESDEGRKVLNLMGIDRYAEPDPALYEPVRKDAAVYDAQR